MKEFGDVFGYVDFSTFIDIVAETAIVSSTLPVKLPFATNLQEFFVHAVLSLDS